jgi:hypothetical protein
MCSALGTATSASTSIYLQSVDPGEIIETCTGADRR